MSTFNLIKLQSLAPFGEIARGSGPLPELDIAHVHWIAVKGMVNDWAVYFSSNDEDYKSIAESGNKLYLLNAVKRLIPCTKNVLRRYRH